MKLHFEDNLDYQQVAIKAVVDIFKGQEINRTEFSVSHQYAKTALGAAGTTESELGIGNKLDLLDDEILENLRAVQMRGGLCPSQSLISGDFTVEMETGTGKTYVYLRTIFELNKEYGFTKFVIVVPSIAIKEGTYKTLQITRDHFENLYPMAKGYEYFLYDSIKPGQVRNFATSANIQIMVVTIGAINKQDVNNLYKETEKMGGEKPIDLIRATKPILIIDEPQSVDGGPAGRGKEALKKMQPLCTLRYSATHVDNHHMVYRLDAIDAYERGLVKQIEVASLEIEGGHNKPFVKLLSTKNVKGSITARIEADVLSGGKAKRRERTVESGDDLAQETGREIYENFRIGEITLGKNNQTMQINMPGGEKILRPNEEVGGVNRDDIQRLLIRRTIKEHLDKEVRFGEQKRNVKVLSLFFIDKVGSYRSYVDGNAVKGKYAEMFEQEYRALAKQPEYQTLFAKINLDTEADAVHDGYFSIDKKGVMTQTDENNQTNRDNAERAYNLIMRDKEKLLGFQSKLKFIFSHSALREGWDNPNVFQICTLREMGSERQRRQTIGRGLRLCVNQDGLRLRGFDVNTLTIIATEHYQKFAENLQKEIEDDTGIRFGLVEKHQFASVDVNGGANDGTTSPLGVQKSEEIWEYLRDQDYLDQNGKAQDILRDALRNNTVELPLEFAEQQSEIMAILRKSAGTLDIKNANERITIKTREAVLESDEFKALWDRIKHKTTYRVDFDNAKLIDNCSQAIKNGLNITKTRARFRTADTPIGKGGVDANEKNVSAYTTIDESDIELPDLLSDLQDKTQLTRKSLVKILKCSRRLNDFKRNPQEFISLTADAINRTKRLALVDGIKYQRVGDDQYYAQELFKNEELTGYLKNTLDTQKSVYERVIYDSVGIEKRFVEDLEANEQVKVYAKLPGWFKISTPMGTYNPDWAVLIEDEGLEKLYFVVETKGSRWRDGLRHKEDAKIACGKAHFTAIAHDGDENSAKYITATTLDDVLAHE